MKRLIIIGLEGVPYGLLNDLSKKGIMSNTQTLIEKGSLEPRSIFDHI